MKKFYYIVGAVATAAAIFALVAIMLRKLKISLSIEGIDDDILDETNDDEITLSIENDESDDEDDVIEREIETIVVDEESTEL